MIKASIVSVGNEILSRGKMVAVPNAAPLRGFRHDFQANFKDFIA